MVALLLAGGIAFAVAILGTPFLIRWLAFRGIGQPIRSDVQQHQKKSGTPTMGGIVIVVGAVLGYMLPHFVRQKLRFSWGGLLVVFAFVGAGAVGLADDWIKVTHKRSLGLNKRAKSGGQLLVALLFALGAHRLANVRPFIGFTRFDLPNVRLPIVVWVLAVVFFIGGFSNAVNLTDGLDGLAAGCSTFAYSSYVVMCF